MASVNNQKVDVVATRESFNFFSTYKLKHFTKTLSKNQCHLYVYHFVHPVQKRIKLLKVYEIRAMT